MNISSLGVTIFVLFVNTAFAGQLDKANELFSKKNYFLAIKELQNIPKASAEREESLYLLDKVVVSFISAIPADDHYIEIRDKTLEQLTKLKVEAVVGHYDGLEYKHQYLKLLKKEFPKSKYIPEIEYRLLDVYSLEDNVKALKDYIKKYPNSPTRWEANLLLARILDDLWEDYYQASLDKPEPQSGRRTKGSMSANKKEAAKYKALSLEEYAKVLDNISDQDIKKDVQFRINNLKKNVADNRKYAEPD